MEFLDITGLSTYDGLIKEYIGKLLGSFNTDSLVFKGVVPAGNKLPEDGSVGDVYYLTSERGIYLTSETLLTQCYAGDLFVCNNVLMNKPFWTCISPKLATSKSAGLMPAADKSLIDVIRDGDKPLPTPTITGYWTVYKQDGTTKVEDKSTSNISLTLDRGFKAKFAGLWKWTISSADKDKYKEPTKFSSDFFNGDSDGNLPSNGAESDESQSTSVVNSNTTYTVTISALQTGLVVASNKVSVASGGVDSKSASANVKFVDYMYRGKSTKESLTADDIVNSLTKLTFDANASYTPGLTDTEYGYHIYPATNADIKQALDNGVQDNINSWEKLSNVSITYPESDATIEYKVYRTAFKGAYKDDKYTLFKY